MATTRADRDPLRETESSGCDSGLSATSTPATLGISSPRGLPGGSTAGCTASSASKCEGLIDRDPPLESKLCAEATSPRATRPPFHELPPGLDSGGLPDGSSVSYTASSVSKCAGTINRDAPLESKLCAADVGAVLHELAFDFTPGAAPATNPDEGVSTTAVAVALTAEEADGGAASDQAAHTAAPALPTPSVPAAHFRIGDLKPSTPSPWAIVACVIARNPVRAWKNWQTAGTLQDIYVADTLRGCTRITLFNDAVTAYRDIVVPGKTCYFSGGRLKKAFSSEKAVEISFGPGSDIHRVPDLTVAPHILTVRLADIAALPDASVVTTITVVHGVGALKRLATKRGKATEKRELLLVDDSDFQMVCTTWGQLARDSGDFSKGIVVVLKDGILSSYNNLRSASIGIQSDIMHDPALSRAAQLRDWYTHLAPDHSFTPLAST